VGIQGVRRSYWWERRLLVPLETSDVGWIMESSEDEEEAQAVCRLAWEHKEKAVGDN